MPLRDITLDEFIIFQRGFDLPRGNRREGSYPVVASTSVHGYHAEYKVPPPGVTTGRSGSLGIVLYIEEPFWPLNTTLWVRDFRGNVPRYVYYFLKTLNLQQYNSGAGVPTLNRNHLDTLTIQIHSVREQEQIAHILASYDYLIENNTRRIAILEEMAQAIYHEWFVEFRFPGHEHVEMVESDRGAIPVAWHVRNLFDLAEVTYGFPFKSQQFSSGPDGRRVIRIRDVPNNRSGTFTFEHADKKYIVCNGDLLVGMDGEFHRGKWAGGEAYLNQRVARFRPKGPLCAYHLFLALERPIEFFNATITGTTVAHLGDKHLRQVNLLVPSADIAAKATELLQPLFELEINLRIRNENLRRTRDLLLPKLISGEIDVEAMEDALAGAAA